MSLVHSCKALYQIALEVIYGDLTIDTTIASAAHFLGNVVPRDARPLVNSLRFTPFIAPSMAQNNVDQATYLVRRVLREYKVRHGGRLKTVTVPAPDDLNASPTQAATVENKFWPWFMAGLFCRDVACGRLETLQLEHPRFYMSNFNLYSYYGRFEIQESLLGPLVHEGIQETCATLEGLLQDRYFGEDDQVVFARFLHQSSGIVERVWASSGHVLEHGSLGGRERGTVLALRRRPVIELR